MADNLPLRLLLATFGGWVNRHQAQAIEYLTEENRVLKEQLGNKRLRHGAVRVAAGDRKRLEHLCRYCLVAAHEGRTLNHLHPSLDRGLPVTALAQLPITVMGQD